MRKSATIVVAREGRDQGDTVTITEMAAIPATEWFIRAMQLLVRSGADVPPNIMEHGVAGFATIGIGTIIGGMGKAPWYEVKPLLDELLTCVTGYQKTGAIAPITQWNVIKGQIEEPSTILQIYEEVVSLHLGFSVAAKLSTYRAMAATMISLLGRNTKTSSEVPAS